MKKHELAMKAAENMKAIKNEIDVERTAKTLEKNMTAHELETLVKRNEKKAHFSTDILGKTYYHGFY